MVSKLLTPVCLAGVLVAVNPAQAQTPVPVTTNTATTLPPRVGVFGERDLSLADALAAVLANNPDIAVSRASAEQAALTLQGAFGVYDPQLSLQTSFVRQVSPVASIIAGTANGALTNKDLLVGPRVQGLLPTFGTSYQASVSARRQTTDSTFTQLNPQYPTALALSVTQPLMRGRKVDAARRQIELSRRNEDLTDAQFTQRVMDVTLQAETAYWDLVFARQFLQVQVQGLELASQAVESNRRLVDQGVGAPIDVVEAQTQLANARQGVFAAQTVLTRAENTLKVLMAGDRSSPFWPVALQPTTPRRESGAETPLADAVTRALANRPELTQMAVAKASNEVNTNYLRDQTRPQVDLYGTYTSSGLAGRTIDLGPNPLTAGLTPLFERINTLSTLQGLGPLDSGGGSGGSGVPEFFVGGLSRSLWNLAKQDFPTVELGVRVGLPLHDRTAQANLASSLVDARRIDVQRKQVEDFVEADVRNAMQAVASARASLEAATDASRLAEQQYASEQRKFEAGTSTVFLVLQRQNALLATRSQRTRAEADLNRSLALLSRATGDILKVHQIAAKAR